MDSFRGLTLSEPSSLIKASPIALAFSRGKITATVVRQKVSHIAGACLWVWEHDGPLAWGVVCFVVDGVLVILSLIVWGVTVTGTTGVIEVSSVIRVAEYGAPDSESIEMSPGAEHCALDFRGFRH